jgi:hypothetical protein
MKKAILGLSGILVAAFVIIMIANAQSNTQEVKKATATTEVSKDCGKCPSASSCAKMTEAKSAEAKACDHSKNNEMKCDPAKCKESCKSATGEAKKCNPATCVGGAKK